MKKTKACLLALAAGSQVAVADLAFEPAPFSIGGVDEAQIVFGDIRNDGGLSALLGGSGSIYSFNNDSETMLTSKSEFRADFANDIFNLVDLNGDGRLDILSYPLTAYINDGQGHFGTTAMSSVRALTNYGSRNVEIHYLDNNPYPEVVVINYRHHEFSNVHVYSNVRFATAPSNGDLEYDDVTTVASLLGNVSGADNVIDLASGDLNGDGHIDVVAANGVSSLYASGQSLVALSDGNGGYVLNQSVSNAQDIALADFDGDGDLDMFLARTNLQGAAFVADELWLNDGLGNFTDSGQRLASTESQLVRVADMDNDGDLDVVVTNENVGATSYSYAHLPQSGKIWLNDGLGVFTDSGVQFGADKTNQDLDLIDIDRDGDIDIVTRNKPIDYDIGYTSINKVKLNQNEIWLNTLISEDGEVADTSAGIAFCQSNPEGCELFSEAALLESYNLGYGDGLLACQQNPASCGLFGDAQVRERESVAYQSGYQSGYQDGLIAGIAEGEAEGYQQGMKDGTTEGYENGYNAGLTDGNEQGAQDMLATCQANPAECGISSGSDPYDVLALIAAIRNALPRGQAVWTCKRNPSAPLCWDSVDDLVSLDELPEPVQEKGKKSRKRW